MILIISGIDPTGQAGLLKDVWVCQKFKQPYFTVPTALTAQNGKKYLGAFIPGRDYFEKLLSCADLKRVNAVKIGMLGHPSVVRFLGRFLPELKRTNKVGIVWDPVLESSTGGRLVTEPALRLALKEILPLTDIITPNAVEASLLLNMKFKKNMDAVFMARFFYRKFHTSVYLKGGHLKKKSEDAFFDGKTVKIFSGRQRNLDLRGTGCTLSTAIACGLARGETIVTACRKAKKFITENYFSEGVRSCISHS